MPGVLLDHFSQNVKNIRKVSKKWIRFTACIFVMLLFSNHLNMVATNPFYLGNPNLSGIGCAAAESHLPGDDEPMNQPVV